LFEPPADRPAEWEILTRLAAILSGAKADDVDVAAIDDGYFSALVMSKGLDPADVMAHYDHGGPERMVDLTIRTGPWGDQYGKVPDGLTLEKVKQAGHGIDMGPMVPRVDEILRTPDKRIRIVPEAFAADVPRLRERLGRRRDGLVLVSRRHLRSKNSWMHNVDVLVKGKDRCTLLIHPADAAGAGLAEGSVARVTSSAGAVEVAIEITDEMKPGVVCLPHGWGHDKEGTRLAVARDHPGVNNNLLAPGTFVDPVSGNAAVNGIPVEVVAV
jgi:anaerobic selenocysteine-containing dehydrogenase